MARRKKKTEQELFRAIRWPKKMDPFPEIRCRKEN